MAAKSFHRSIVFLFAIGLTCLEPTQASASIWTIKRTVDRFTDEKTCRVTPLSEFSRAIVAGLMKVGYTSYFFAEIRDNGVRVGVTSDSNIPVAPEIQLRIDSDPAITITSADTPVDQGPTIPIPNLQNLPPAVRDSIARSMQTAMAIMSPYRVVTGDRAKEILRRLVSAKKAMWRPVIGVNAQFGETVNIPINGLADALRKCGISLQ